MSCILAFLYEGTSAVIIRSVALVFGIVVVTFGYAVKVLRMNDIQRGKKP